MADGGRSSDFSASFWKTLAAREVTAKDRAAILKALRRLDENEQHPPLRIKKRADHRTRSWRTRGHSRPPLLEPPVQLPGDPLQGLRREEGVGHWQDRMGQVAEVGGLHPALKVDEHQLEVGGPVFAAEEGQRVA